MTKVFSEEHRRKLSEAHKGKHSGMYGKKHTDEAKAKMANAHKGKHHDDATKKKMSIKRTVYWQKVKGVENEQ